MASRINTKFVILLSVVVLGLLGLVAVAYSVVKKTGADHIASGDKMAAAGDYENAKMFYGKAVNKDLSRVDWMDKWIDSMTHLTPSNETEYQDMFFKDYIGAMLHRSSTLRTNIDAHREVLDIDLALLNTSYSRNGADRLIESATRALSYFDGQPEDGAEWETLRRYRGLGYDMIAQARGVLSDDQIELYQEDLQAALNANNDDSDVLAALVRWKVFDAIRNQLEGDTTLLFAKRDEGIADCEQFLATHPNDPLISSMLLTMKLDRAREVHGEGLEGAERTQEVLAAFRVFKPELDAIFDYLMNAEKDQLRMDILDQLLRAEAAIDAGQGLDQTVALSDRIVELNAGLPKALWVSARINQQAGDIDAALNMFQAIVDLPQIPLSLDGLMLYTRKQQSLISIAEIKLNQLQLAQARFETEGGDEVDGSLLAEIEELVEQISIAVSDDDYQLLLLRGRVSEAKGDLNDALSMYKKYNEQTNRRFVDGLWREGTTARQLGQLGVAKSALERLVSLRKSDVRARITLADIEIRLDNYDNAIEQYNKILEFDYDNEQVRELLESAMALQDPTLLIESDPALALILRARQIRTGFEGQPGDLASAIELLRNGIMDPAIDYEPRASRELAMLLMDNGDLVGARATLVQSAARYADDESMTQMAEAMAGDDPVTILVSLIRLSDRPEVDQEISIANVYLRNNRTDELDATLARLDEIAPTDPRVIELEFNRAIGQGDIARSEQITKRAVEQNIDGVRGLTFKARIAAQSNDHDRAIELLKQATALGNASAAVYRMLAIEQGRTGQIDPASESFQQAISIRPDDGATIYEYVAMLTRGARFERALDVARANQKYGIGQSNFNNLWLMLEANYGGDQGRDFAIRQRERMFELNASDTQNAAELARMYIEAKRWDESKAMISSLRAQDDTLTLVELEAKWNADQGRVGKESGLMLAQRVYADYIAALGEEASEAPYLSLARFMLDRGRPDLARQAANRAVELEDPSFMNGSKMQGDLFMATNQFAAASEAYARVVQSGNDPDDSYRTKLIEANLRIGKHQEALELLDSLDESVKESKIAMLQRAEILNAINKFAEAREVLDGVVAKYPDDPIVYVKRAESMIGEQDLMADLLSDVDQALKINANDWRAYRVRAAAYFAVAERDKAMQDLLSAVRINPNLDEALFGVLNELVDTDRSGEAIDLAKEVIERRPNDAPLMSQMGQVFASRREWNHATEMYAMAWEKRRAPADGAAYVDSIVRMSSPDTDAANAVINELAELVGGLNKSAGLLAAQALVLDARGRSDFAIQQLTKAFDISLENDRAIISWHGNMVRFFEEKDASEELAYLESVRRRTDVDQIQKWLDLFISMRLVNEKQDPQRADALLTRLSEQGENPTRQLIAFQTHGSQRFELEDYEGAVDVWAKGLVAFPESWELNNNIAFAYSEHLDRPQDALDYALAATESKTANSAPYETLARVYIKLGQFEKASENIKLGKQRANTTSTRITMILADARLNIAKEDLETARFEVLNARSIYRSIPGGDEDIEKSISEVEEEITSAG